MLKKGEQWGSSWKSRFFRLEGDKLRYYASREDSAAHAKGEIDISKGPTVRFSDEKASGGQVEIEIVTPDRTYRLRCHSMQEAHHWISGLRQAVAAMAAPASDPAMRAREKSFRRLVQEDAFQKLDSVPYRCRCVGSAAAGPRPSQRSTRGGRDDRRVPSYRGA